MRFNAHKENIIFESKTKRKNNILISSVEQKNLLEDIEKIKNNKENIYIFKSGDKAEFLYERSCVNDLSFNYFQIYNKSVFKALEKIYSMTRELCIKNSIDINKTIYYITSEYEDEFLEDYWYDSGGMSIPSFCGYWFLETKDLSYIKVNDEKINISSGDIVMFESGSRTEFSNIEKGISFNIATLSQIKGQYPQKWTPMVFADIID